MATNAISIPINLQAQIDNLKEIRSTLTNSLNAAGKDSTLAKNLKKQLEKVDSSIRDIEEIAISPTIDEHGLKNVQKLFDKVVKDVRDSFSQIDFSGFEQIASNEEIARLKVLVQEASKLRKEKEAIQKSGSSEKTESYLTRTNNQGLLTRGKAVKGFDATATLNKNAAAMQKAADSFSRSAEEAGKAYKELEQEVDNLFVKASASKQRAQTLDAQRKTLATDSRLAGFHYEASRFNTSFSANSQVSNPTIKSIQTGLRSTLETVYADGTIATDARDAVSQWIRQLAPNVSVTEAANLVQQDLTTLLRNLMEKIFGKGYLADSDLVYSPEHANMLARAQGYSVREINRLTQKHSTANVSDIQTRSNEISAQYAAANAEFQKYNNEIDRKIIKWENLEKQESDYLTAAEEAEKLSKELYNLANAAQASAMAVKESQIVGNEEEQRRLREDRQKKLLEGTQKGRPVLSRIGTEGEEFFGSSQERILAAQNDNNEAKRFKEELQASVQHWMSAQQIINLVKDGIRQAYQDIQNLDKAMTNIAVVTDMSVGDLWGKINEYMSIAQQYGVTTQGVYEVSQLYYQQGLSTSEVMAATTETLKMARIAGMDYAEAADAMTVAIRSFKMEMADASHVTDVYSKVAAVTASDTEELAIAMSKTASSAESVGSSFENTTAMLAVMIETTRESAQNLGSALKSIISRYGEMKSGMTQDSDGEIIDYNKTDAALRSVGISLKDAQGQFRDFDDVIFELSKKWDSLDKNTQRYIATIMAGNRQQSRFIALVDNWERLDEVTSSAQDSEDAGLLQYAKTLDSLDTKLNNLKTSFQSFYMSIFNGEFFKGAVDLVNNLIQNFSRLGPILGGINLLQLINQVRLLGQLLINTFSGSLSKIIKARNEWQNSFTGGWTSVGEKIATAIANAIVAKANLTGKQFAEGVEQGAKNAGQNQPKTKIDQVQSSFAGKIQSTYIGQAQQYLKQAGIGLSVGNLFNDGRFTKEAYNKYLINDYNGKTPQFEKLVESYQKQAETILNNAGQFDEAITNWATKVKTAGENFSQNTNKASQAAYLRALKAADEEAAIEIAAAKQAAAEQKKAAVQQKWGQGLVIAGTALSSAGMMTDQSTMKGYDLSTGLQAAGGALSTVGQAVTGNYVGAAVTAITTLITAFQRFNERVKVELENAAKAVESANTKRAEKKEELRSLSDYAKKLKEVEAARFDSNEAEEEWLNLNNEIAEKYPELINYIDSEGNAIVNLTADYDGLTTARLEAAEATAFYYREQQKLYKLKADAAKQSTAKDITTSPWDMHHVLFYGNLDTESEFKQAYGKIFTETEEGGIDLNSKARVSYLSRLAEIGSLDDFILRVFGLTETDILSLLDSWNGDEPALSAEDFRGINAKSGYNLIERLLEEGYQPANYFALGRNRDNYQSFNLRGIKKLLGDESIPDKEAATILEEYGTQGISAIISRGVGLSDLVQAASSGDLELAQIARSIGSSAGVLKYFSETNSWGLSDNQEKIQQWKDVEQYAMLSESNARAWASSEGAIYLYNTAAQETLTAINGYEEILLNRAIILAGGADKLGSFISEGTRIDGQLITLEDVYTTYAEEVATWYSGLSSVNQELLQNLLSSSTSYSLVEMQSSLGNMGLSESKNLEIYKAIMQTWYTDNYTAKYRGMKAIWGDTVEVMSLDEWKASDKYGEKQAGLTDEEAYYQYTQEILNQIETDDVDLQNILKTASLQQQNQFVSWWKAQKELVEKSEGYAVDIINTRLAEVTSATRQLLDEKDTMLDLGEVQLDIQELDQDARTTLFNLLTSENLGTNESIDEIINFLVSQGVTVNEAVRNALEEWVYENINTRVAMLVDDIDNFATKLSELSSKQEKGFTFAESESYLKQLQKLKPDKNWNDYFQVDEKGLITFIDFGTSLKELYQAQIEQYNNEANYLNEKILTSLGFNKEDNNFESPSSLDSVLEEGDLKAIFEHTGEEISDAEKDIRSALKDTFEQSDIDFIIQQIKSGHFKTKEDIQNYFKELSANLTSGTDYLIAQYQASLRDLGFVNATKAYTDSTQIKNLLESGSVADLQNLWLKSLTDDTVATVDDKALAYKSGEWDDKYWEQYYTDKMSELKGAHFDAYGQLIITDYKTYAEYIAGLQGWSKEDNAYKNLLQNAGSIQFSVQEAASDSIQTGLEELYATAIEEQELSWDNISNIIQASNLDIEIQNEILNNYENAKRQGVTGYIAFINYLTKTIQNSSNGNQLDLTALNAANRDAQNTLASSLVSSLEQGLEGTLTNTDFNALIEQIGKDTPEAYRQYVTETYEGLEISAEGALVIASQLIDKFSNTSLVAESLIEQLGGSGALGSYEDVDNLINDIINDTDHWGHGNEEILKLLYQMRDEYSQLAEDAQFDFMNQDHFDGAADNWYTFTNNMSTVIEKLKTAFEKGGKIDYKSFDNIVTWISDLSVDGLDTQLGNTGKTLGEFTDAVLATVDATGNLDLSAAAINLGISMDDMAGALEGGLQEVAKQQVAYWKHYLNFLKGIKALQEASDEIIVEPPQVGINNEGKYTYGGQDNLTAEQAYSYWLTDVYKNFEDLTITDFDGNTVQIFSGNNNPLRQLMSFKPELFTIGDDGSVQIKEGMTSYVQQYMNQLNAWVRQEFTTGDITKHIDQETGTIKIPWNEVFQIEIDTSGAPAGTANNAKVAGKQTQDAAERAAESALAASDMTPNGDGSYTYTLNDMTLKIQMGANGSVEIDLTNATGTLPSAAELRKVFEGQEGFKATDDNNWVFTDPNLGFKITSSNGKLDFDTSGMTPPPLPTATELSAILGTTWESKDGGKTYTATLNGVSFTYTSATGQLNINASSFQLAGGLDATSLATILGGTWSTEDKVTYTATIAGTNFIYESSSGLVKIDGSKFTLAGGLSADELKTILGGTWSSDDNVNYESIINGVKFTYKGTTGEVDIDPSGFTVSANLTADQLKTLLGGTWTSEDGVTYKSTINGATFTYESRTGKLVVTPPTAPTEPTNADFITLMQAQGWKHENGVYTKDFAGGTLTYNAQVGTLSITPSSTMEPDTPDIETLLNSAFGVGGWEPNTETGGYNILDAVTGEVLYTLPAKVTITPAEGSNVTLGENGLTADVDVTLTPNTDKIDDTLSTYEDKIINLNIGFDKGSLVRTSESFQKAASALWASQQWRTFLNTENWDFLEGSNKDEAERAFGALVTEASILSEAGQLTQDDLSIIKGLGTSLSNAGMEVADMLNTLNGLTVSNDNSTLTELTAFSEAFGGPNLFGNLTALTSLLTAMTNPVVTSLDLTGFIAQLQSLGELELDDEEIENLTVIALALADALAPLETATVNPIITIDDTQAISAIDEIKKALDDLPETKTITIDQRPGLLPLKKLYTGNVNGIAYAEGNVNKLISGAHLANKTLVGELGPELAVYNNQYHLLGRDGAEFVNLPSDAIVFNHRQTEGIIKGQTGYRGKALVNGNVSGPAAASGIDAAIAAVENIIALWSNLGNQSVSDLLANSGGGGGGGGNELKAVTAELQEWYNLTRRIAYEEQEINNLIAERNNILDGGDYLKNLRETEKHLKSQRVLQSQLLDYQTQQLQRQADFINDHDIWSKYLYIDENGLLQYINGNETNGGKGALEILESFNKMSGEEQQKYLKSVNYSFTDQDGKELEGSELAEKFLEQLQAQIDQYDELYDTVHSTEETIEGINSNIKEINEEIKQNQMDLEQAIYEIIESAWEKEIEQLEKQVELIEEANNAYVEGLQDALNAEKEAYSDNQSIEEREALQRQLSLLRRSGGSASEIADLEKQLDDTLKDEYFRNQEKMIEKIEEANENQIKLLEKQIALQEEALAFEKENGVLWTKVYEVMSRSEAEILEFMQGNHTDFFSQSLLQQEKMLTDWAKKIGIYSEDRQYQNHVDTATSIWNSQGFWNSNTLKGLQNTYNQLSSEDQSDLRDIFSTTYAQEIMAGSNADKARLKAEEEVKTYLDKYQKENSSQNTESSGNNGGSNQGGNGGLNHSKLYYGGYTKNHTFIGGENCYADGLAAAKNLARGKGIEVDKGNDWFRTGSSPVKAWRKWYVAKGDKKLTQDYSTKSQAENARISGISGNYNNYANAQRSGADAATIAKLKQIYEDFNSSDIKFYSTGGLVDYTGLAMVHGSKSKPEGFLNAEQTAQIKEALSITSGKENLLSNLRTTVDKLRSLIHNISTIDNSNNYEINIAPGAVAIQVAQIADSYDIEELSNDVMNRMVAIASKATNRGVNRR